MSASEIDTLKRQYEALLSQNIRILGILENDGNIGKTGLVQKVDKIQESVTGLLTREETTKAFKKGQMFVYGAVGAVILWVIKVCITFLIPIIVKFL